MSRKVLEEVLHDPGKEARIIYRKRPGGGISRWAPTVDLLRDPRWGRNEEAYGDDPVQVGAMASAYVRGIQTDDGKGRLTCASTLKPALFKFLLTLFI